MISRSQMIRRRAKRAVLLATVASTSLTALPITEACAVEVVPRAIVRSVARTAYATDLGAPVARIGAREGDTFAKGDLLVAFDCRRQRAELAAAEAAHAEMKLTLDSNIYLDERRAVARHDVEISRARANRAGAEVEALSVRLEQCEIRAPFDGRVADLAIFEHETPAVGRPFLTVVADRNLELELIVPATWLKWLAIDARFTFQVEELDRPMACVISRIGAEVDAVSQTITVFGRIEGDATGVLAGMSGNAVFHRSGD